MLVAVDEDADALRDLESELRDRYARHYRVVGLRSSEEAQLYLEDLAVSDDEVALVLSGQRLSSATGAAVLKAARRLHPHAKRGLVIAWGDGGDREIGKAIFDAMAHGLMDIYVLRPSAPFSLPDSDQGRALLAATDDPARLPIVVFPNGKILTDPSNADLARAAGSTVHPDRIDFDLGGRRGLGRDPASPQPVRGGPAASGRTAAGSTIVIGRPQPR